MCGSREHYWSRCCSIDAKKKVWRLRLASGRWLRRFPVCEKALIRQVFCVQPFCLTHRTAIKRVHDWSGCLLDCSASSATAAQPATERATANAPAEPAGRSSHSKFVDSFCEYVLGISHI